MTDVFRKNYKVLDDYHINAILKFKSKAEELLQEMELVESHSPEHEHYACEVDRRCMALAKTNLEQAVMWAVKAIT